MNLTLKLQLPHLWGDEIFDKSTWGPITYFVGPNGTGKTLLAEALRTSAQSQGIRARYLNAERLAGIEKMSTGGQFTSHQFERGFDLSQLQQLIARSGELGMAMSGLMTLRDKMDVRVRVEARLAQLFGRTVRLAEEGGFLRVKLRRGPGQEYDLKQHESQGLKELIALLAALFDDEYDLMIVDEPELHLHPQYQAFYMAEVRNLSGDSQQSPGKKTFILITHSPYVVDIRTLEELRNVLVFRPNGAPRTIGELDANDEYRIRRLLPRLNTHHKQFFFASAPVFVEGYRDQQLFTLIEERRQRQVAAAGSGFIDVGGKEELDVFFRLASSLRVDARFITDVDAVLVGNLRQSIGADARCATELQSTGHGADLMMVIGQLLGDLDKVSAQVATVIAGPEGLTAPQVELLNTVLAEADIDRRRLRALTSLTLLGQIASLTAVVSTARGRLTVVRKAMEGAGVFVHERGSLEAYLPSFEGDVAFPSDTAKMNAFDSERNYLLDPNTPAAEINTHYPGLTETLDLATESVVFSLDEYLALAISDLIHNIQSGFRRKEWHDLESLNSNEALAWPRYSRFVAVTAVDVDDQGFQCTLKFSEFVDPLKRSFTFSNRSVAADFTLPVA